MCHQIKYVEGTTFLKYSGKLVCGVKRFKVAPEGLLGLHTGIRYKFVQGGWFFYVEEGDREQDVEFFARLVNNEKGDLIASRRITCGYHISPFLFGEYDKDLIFYFDPYDKSDMAVPVLFTAADVLFYDGETISVERFMIPPVFREDYLKEYVRPKYLNLLKIGSEKAVAIIKEQLKGETR